MTIRRSSRRATTSLAVAVALLAGCQLPPILGLPAEVPEGPEPNGIDIGDGPTLIAAPFPVLLTGALAVGDSFDRFIATLSEPGDLTVACTDEGIGITLRDVSTGSGTTGGCGSNLSLASDSGDVEVIVHAPDPATYRVRIDVTSSCGTAARC